MKMNFNEKFNLGNLIRHFYLNIHYTSYLLKGIYANINLLPKHYYEQISQNSTDLKFCGWTKSVKTNNGTKAEILQITYKNINYLKKDLLLLKLHLEK